MRIGLNIVGHLSRAPPNMTLQIVFALYPVCLAGVALYWALTAQPGSRFRWGIEIAVSGSIVAFAFLAGPWAFTSYYLRYAALGAFALVVLYTYRCARLASAMQLDRTPRRLAFSVTILGLFMILNALAVASHVRPSESLDLSFPLASGTYYVLQGGNSVVTNPFHSLSGTKLAFDIVALNAFGNRANGVASRTLADYEIFGDIVYSPCEGTVLAVQDALADNPPGAPDTEHSANYVTMKCGEVEIFMAHLMQGSATVTAGKMVTLKQPLGRVGNSGNTLEPHLHIGAKKNGAEMGLVFDGRWLSMNSMVIRTQRDAQPVTAADRSQAGGR
jgi:Peptidase family M23